MSTEQQPQRQIKLVLAYDGTRYSGWQRQPDRTTVQGTLEDALQRLLGVDTRTTGCGRTDAGVHALRQTVTFFTDSTMPVSTMPAAAFRPALNRFLPDDVTVLEACDVALDFHPISDIVRKRYRYVISDRADHEVFLGRYCWQRRCPLDAERMHSAAQALVGTHDFSSFETTGSPRTSSVRTVFEVSVQRVATDAAHLFSVASSSGFVVLEIEADGFLYNMVRTIVGSLVEVGRGAKEEGWLADVLAACDRSAAGPTAPPTGLFMVDATYSS